MIEVFYSKLDVWMSSDEFKKRMKEETKKKLLLDDFLKKFTLDFVKNMSIDDYVLGKKDHTTFCYYIEYSLEAYGATGGQTTAPQKYGIHWDKKNGKYSFGGKKVKKTRFGSNSTIIFQNIKNALISLIEDTYNGNYDGIVNSRLNPQFKNKISFLYSSNTQLPIYSEDDLNIILSALEIPYSLSSDRFYKRKKLYEFYLANEISALISPLLFMNFLYSNFGYRKLLRSKEKLPTIEKTLSIAFNLNLIDVELLSRNDDTDNTQKNTGSRKGSKYDPFIDEKKKITGKKAEQLVINYLNSHKRELCINGDVKAWCEEDDSKGYDISYFQTDGIQVYIEVKGVSYDIKERIMFEISSNQMRLMRKYPESYYIFFINDVDNPKTIKRILAKNIDIENFIPVKYRINVKSIESDS